MMIKFILNAIAYYLNFSKKLYITEKAYKLFKLNKKIRPYAFIRVCNEIKTIDASLKSILPHVKGGVIGFNSCNDGSKEYIIEFCKKNPQFTPIEYPYDVFPAYHESYKNDRLDYNKRLDTYYNYIWEKLPKNEWVIKIDADHLWIDEYFEMLLSYPLRKKDIVILNRINLHCIDNTVYVNKNLPIYEPGDHWIIFNDKDYKFEFYRGWDDDKFRAFEYLPISRKNIIYGVLANYHFPIIKNQRNNFKINEWIPICEFNIEEYIEENNMKDRIPKKLLDEEFILKSFR
ncbi:hypothetical protein, partial [Pasteurella multocida]|uniref:hypothetical protein n=1 Tax=Pasteurella multocida TaxID=747 RepID=UPI0020221868